MNLSHLFFGNDPGEQGDLCRQMGIGQVIAKLSPELTGNLPPWDMASLHRSTKQFGKCGLQLVGLEGDQFDMNRIKFGFPGRDNDIRLYQQMLRNMGELGVDLLCYNFMAGIGWYRTEHRIPARGGATVSGFDFATAMREPLTDFGKLTEDALWENYTYFLERVLPVAEASGVRMALHPDDPPVSPLRGIGRIFTTASAIDRALALSSSPAHGLTFCQGTYVTMGEDIRTLAKRWASRIYFIHFRDVSGSTAHFRETFHDNGPTDMAAIFRVYRSIGFTGPIRSDHVPQMAGETDEAYPVGYGLRGNLFGIGYIKGLMDGVGIG